MVSVLLVGASNELKERKLGKIIDTFDIVARINNGGNSKCMSGKYTDIVGTKLDIWFSFHTGCFIGNKQFSQKYKEVFLKPEAYSKYKHSEYNNLKSFPNSVLDFTKNTLKSFNGFNSVVTSGMNALFYLIKKYENVSVCGFDGFKTGHWYGNMFIHNQDESDKKVSESSSGRHDVLREFEYFNYLKTSNVIKVI